MHPSENTKSREGTYRLIVSKFKQEPYLLMFSIGLLGGTLGLGSTTVGVFQENNILMVLGFVTWVLLLIATLYVIRYVEGRRPVESAIFKLDKTSQEAFLEGNSAKALNGTWKAEWFEGEGENRKKYALDPQETIEVDTHQSRIFCVANDLSRNTQYWLYGRLSDRDIITLVYWSKPVPQVSGLSGTVFLKLEKGFDSTSVKLKGWWRGFTADDEGRVTTGEVEWTRMQ